MRKVLVILRHANSLDVVRDYLQEKNIQAISVALDPVELPAEVDAAMEQIRSAVSEGVDVVVLGTKVYDNIKMEKTDPPLKLIEFLGSLKDMGIATTPVCMTHLGDMPVSLVDEARATGLQISYVENDNLKRDGMTNLGPLIMSALALS